MRAWLCLHLLQISIGAEYGSQSTNVYTIAVTKVGAWHPTSSSCTMAHSNQGLCIKNGHLMPCASCWHGIAACAQLLPRPSSAVFTCSHGPSPPPMPAAQAVGRAAAGRRAAAPAGPQLRAVEQLCGAAARRQRHAHQASTRLCVSTAIPTVRARGSGHYEKGPGSPLQQEETQVTTAACMSSQSIPALTPPQRGRAACGIVRAGLAAAD